MSFNDIPDAVLARAAQRAAKKHPVLMSRLIATWQSGFPNISAAAALECSDRTLNELALCRRPRHEQWVADVHTLADTLQIDTDLLINFLRAAESIERFNIAHPA